MTLYLDLETYSECPISHGTPRYASHPSTEILLIAYAIGDGPVSVWDLTGPTTMPLDLERALLSDCPVVIHNSFFDRSVMRETEFFDLPPERIEDTMVQALAHGLPGALDKLGTAFGLAEDKAKSKAGRALIHFFCKPVRGKRNFGADHPERWAQFVDYAAQDVVAMRELRRKMPRWNYPDNKRERALWCLDQRINDRGILVDTELAHAAVQAAATERETLNAATHDATDGEVEAATQRDAMLAHVLREYGVTLPDMTQATLKRRLDDPALPAAVKHLLDLRLQSSRNSSAKYTAAIRAVSEDGRLRAGLQFCGAATSGRWAGRVVQPQNLMRPTMPYTAIETAIDDIKAGAAPMLYSNLPEVLGNAVRGLFVAPEGRKLVCSDLKSIEGRGLAWLADDERVVQFYRDFDAGKVFYDSYQLAYTLVFGGDPAKVTKAERTVGKPIELACLGAETLVVTSNGVKRLVDVETEDRLWDGEQWVTHQGVVGRGVRPVVNVEGIEVTGDHQILCQRSWKEASELASSETILRQALETGSASLKSLALQAEGGCPFAARVARSLTPWTSTTCEQDEPPAALAAPSSPPPEAKNSISDTQTSCLTTSIGGGFSTAFPPRETAAATPAAGSGVPMEGEASPCTPDGSGAHQVGVRGSPTLSPSKGGTTLTLNSTGSTTTKGMRQETCASSPERSMAGTAGPCANSRRNSTLCVPTYDIAHAGSRNRFTVLTERGALVVHNCGYGGGVAAFLTFAAVYHLDLDHTADLVWEQADGSLIRECEGKFDWAKKQGFHAGMDRHKYAAFEYIKTKWRQSRQPTSVLWRELADAFRFCVAHDRTAVGIREGKLKMRRDGQWMRLRLPSGRCITMLQPRVGSDGQITYKGLDRYTRQWADVFTHGGKLAGVVTQSFARDVLAHNMPLVESSGFDIVLSVHDELITEAPDAPGFSAAKLNALMSRVPEWAQGLPLAADGFEAKRYRKDG